MLFGVPLQLITEDHLQGLVDDHVAEGRQTEYKQDLPGNTYDEVIEFLKDISSMANSFGGDVLYGVREGQDEAGNTVAISIDGIASQDADQIKLRFENLLRNSLKPRLIGLQISPIVLANGNQVFVVRVPRSWNGPHVVEYQRHWRFYYRNSAGSHPMDVGELRHAFTLADSVSQRLEAFRLDQLARIASDERFSGRGAIVLHLQPLDSVDQETSIEFLRARQDRSRLFLIYHCAAYLDDRFTTDYSTTANFDGLISQLDRNPATGYVQVYRNGIIESVDTTILHNRHEGSPVIPGMEFERKVVNATSRYLGLLQSLGVVSPVLLSLALLGVKGYRMQGTIVEFGVSLPAVSDGEIDRDDLLFRSKLIHSIPPDANEEFARDLWRENFHALWNASGVDGSPSYDQEGNWMGPR